MSTLAILLVSSGILHWGERAAARGDDATQKLSIVLTMGLGLAALTMLLSMYRLPIVGVIARTYEAYMLLALVMLSYVLVRPSAGVHRRPSARLMKSVALVWDLAGVAWAVIVVFVYLLPRMQ